MTEHLTAAEEIRALTSAVADGTRIAAEQRKEIEALRTKNEDGTASAFAAAALWLEAQAGRGELPSGVLAREFREACAHGLHVHQPEDEARELPAAIAVTKAPDEDTPLSAAARLSVGIPPDQDVPDDEVIALLERREEHRAELLDITAELLEKCATAEGRLTIETNRRENVEKSLSLQTARAARFEKALSQIACLTKSARPPHETEEKIARAALEAK